jgi:hypothetical protein
VPECRERTGSYQCVGCHGLWDGPQTWLDPYDLQRLCCGEPECRAAVEQVSPLPLRSTWPPRPGPRRLRNGCAGMKAAPERLTVASQRSTRAVLLQRLEAKRDELRSFVSKKTNRHWGWGLRQQCRRDTAGKEGV